MLKTTYKSHLKNLLKLIYNDFTFFRFYTGVKQEPSSIGFEGIVFPSKQLGEKMGEEVAREGFLEWECFLKP
jgi:hypothetical protein